MRLKELRKENKKTQLELAKKLNIAESTYCCYEKGINEPNLENLIKLADYYSVSLDYLVGRNFTSDVGYLTDSQRMLLTIIKNLTEYNQAKLLGMAQGLLIGQN